MARNILERYVKAGSENEVNVGDGYRDLTKARIDQGGYDANLFDEGERQIWEMLRSKVGLFMQER